MPIINEIQWCNSMTTDGFKQTIVMPDSPICLNTARVGGSARTAALWKWWREASVIHSDPRYLNCCLVKVCCWCLDDIGGERGRCDAISVSSLCIKEEEQQVNCCFRVRRARVTGSCSATWRAAPCGCRWDGLSETWGRGTVAELGPLKEELLVTTNTTRDR